MAGRHGQLGECLRPIGTYAPVGVVYDCFGFLGSSLDIGRRPGFDIPQAKMLEDLFYLPAIASATLSQA